MFQKYQWGNTHNEEAPCAVANISHKSNLWYKWNTESKPQTHKWKHLYPNDIWRRVKTNQTEKMQQQMIFAQCSMFNCSLHIVQCWVCLKSNNWREKMHYLPQILVLCSLSGIPHEFIAYILNTFHQRSQPKQYTTSARVHLGNDLVC